MTPQDDTFLIPTLDDSIAPCATEDAVILTLLPRISAEHDIHAPHSRGDELAPAWPMSIPTSTAPQQRAYALPALPQGASSVQRRWHLSLADGEPRDNAVQVSAHDRDVANQTRLSSSVTPLSVHGTPARLLSLARQMMEQESPVTEQGPPAIDTPGISINGAPDARRFPG